MPGIPPDSDRLAEKLARLHLRLFPRPFSNHATEWSGIVGEGTSVCRFKSVPTSADRFAHARQALVSSQSIPCCFRCLAVNSVLRLKPYLVVKIAPDILTEYCCQVCVLVMMFCRPDCRLCAGMCGKSGTSVPRVLTNSRRVNFTVQFGVLTCWHSGRPTWDMKNILYIWFSHFTLTETHLC